MTTHADPTARTLTPAQQATTRAAFRDYHLCQIEAGDSLKHVFHHARQACENGAYASEVLMRLEAWADERGLLS